MPTLQIPYKIVPFSYFCRYCPLYQQFSRAISRRLSYDILQAAVTVIWCVSMVILFIDVIIICLKYHDTFARTRLAPDWVFYLCSILGLVASAFGVYVTFTGPWTTLVSYSQWLFRIGGIGILSLIVGIILFFVGQKAVKKDVSDEEIIAQVTN